MSNCAGIVAVSVVADTKVPANVYPPIDTKAVAPNPVPVIVITVSDLTTMIAGSRRHCRQRRGPGAILPKKRSRSTFLRRAPDW